MILSPVRCPKCDKKLAERLNGEAEFTCRGCKSIVRVINGRVLALTVV